MNSNEGKTIAIISYLWWVGLLIAFIMNNKARSGFASFHIRQSLGLSLMSFAIGIIVKYGIDLVGNILFLGVFVLWVIGLLGAIQNEEKEIPFIGNLFQEWFRNI